MRAYRHTHKKTMINEKEALEFQREQRGVYGIIYREEKLCNYNPTKNIFDYVYNQQIIFT